MIEHDTIRLLRECDAGVRMGTSSIGDAMDSVHDPALRQALSACKKEHEALGGEIGQMLHRFGDRGKDPGAVAKGMAHMKMNMRLAAHDADSTIADMMTDGCNMGVKSLNKYLNRYKAADEPSKDVAKRLIHLEERLTAEMRRYL